jgi:hypothetical protein
MPAHLGVEYHHKTTKQLMHPDPDTNARLKAWTRTEPVDQVTIGPDERLHPDQSSVNFGDPRGETVGPIHVADDGKGDRYVLDGHHRLAQARRRGESVDALLWRNEPIPYACSAGSRGCGVVRPFGPAPFSSSAVSEESAVHRQSSI